MRLGTPRIGTRIGPLYASIPIVPTTPRRDPRVAYMTPRAPRTPRPTNVTSTRRVGVDYRAALAAHQATQRPVQPRPYGRPVQATQPTHMGLGRTVCTLAVIMVMGVLALVGMCLLAAWVGIVPMQPTQATPTPAPSATSHSVTHVAPAPHASHK